MSKFVVAEYLKNSKVDLGRLLATTRTLLASWTLVVGLTAAMFLGPVVIHGFNYAEARADRALDVVLSHTREWTRIDMIDAAKSRAVGLGRQF